MKTFIFTMMIACTLVLSFASCESKDGPSTGNNGDASNTADGGGDGDGDGDVDGDTDTNNDPLTCEEALDERSYIGCEFWPTVTYNPVHKTFDFAVVAANAGDKVADIVVERGGSSVATATIEPNSLGTIILPWVSELKGPAFSDNLTFDGRADESVRVNGGAYKLTSSTPITLWQFNPLQYQSEDFTDCIYILANDPGRCLSVSNDASLLLPAAAMTGSYQAFGRGSEFDGAANAYANSTPMAMTITAVEDNTTVDVKLSGDIEAGTGVTAAIGGSIETYSMNAGDVIQLLGAWGNWNDANNTDLSGTIINADKHVQVISVNPITYIPGGNEYGGGHADHIEETILPSEVIGNEYIVATPTSPDAKLVGHIVRFYGTLDNTTLTYPDGDKPAGAPDTLNAGETVELDAIATDFRVTGTNPFAMASFTLGGETQDPGEDPTRGDPAFTMLVTPKQFRKSYVFLAPVDYMENYAVILVENVSDVSLTLDGSVITETPAAIGTGNWSAIRVKLSNSNGGVHHLVSSEPVGLQIMGFGHATGYYYPGGLNLKHISPPVVIQ